MCDIYIDPRSRYNYVNFYILGVRQYFTNAKIHFDITPFPKHLFNRYRQNNSCLIMIVGNIKIYIDADDKVNIAEDAYAWCDVYGKINVLDSQLQAYKKIYAIGPSFGITLDAKAKVIIDSIRNFYNIHQYSDISFRAFLKDYLYTFLRRRPLNCYMSKEKEIRIASNYIFHASTLWYNQFAATDTNMYRGEFLKACKKAGMDIEGGLFYVNSPTVLAEMPDYPKYLTLYKDFIYEERLSMDDYIRKTKESVLVFNTPSVGGCHGWKLAEYLCMGKAIISTPLTREMPEGMVHGENIHFVNSPEEIYDAVIKINSDELYRKKLEKGARAYYEKWLAPEVVVKRLIDACR